MIPAGMVRRIQNVKVLGAGLGLITLMAAVVAQLTVRFLGISQRELGEGGVEFVLAAAGLTLSLFVASAVGDVASTSWRDEGLTASLVALRKITLVCCVSTAILGWSVAMMGSPGEALARLVAASVAVLAVAIAAASPETRAEREYGAARAQARRANADRAIAHLRQSLRAAGIEPQHISSARQKAGPRLMAVGSAFALLLGVSAAVLIHRPRGGPDVVLSGVMLSLLAAVAIGLSVWGRVVSVADRGENDWWTEIRAGYVGVLAPQAILVGEFATDHGLPGVVAGFLVCAMPWLVGWWLRRSIAAQLLVLGRLEEKAEAGLSEATTSARTRRSGRLRHMKRTTHAQREE